MAVFVRSLLVVAFALFALGGAYACERGVSAEPMSQAVRASDAGCPDGAAGHGHGAPATPNHCHAGCCTACCSLHYGASPAALRFDARAPGASSPIGAPEPLRAGITHAPPLPPPIA